MQPPLESLSADDLILAYLDAYNAANPDRPGLTLTHDRGNTFIFHPRGSFCNRMSLEAMTHELRRRVIERDAAQKSAA